MTARFLALSLCAFSLVGCGSDDSTPATTTDTGTSTTDTGTSTTDTGTSTTDTGTSTEDTGTPPGDTGGDAGPAPTCDEYCTTVMANCTGAKNSQYIDKDRCLAICKNLTLGAAGDKSGDTVACRLYHANNAKVEGPDLHCPHAGMSGGKVCGASRCDAYCKVAQAQCAGKAPFASEADCKTKCPESSFSATAAGGELDQMKGTLNCMQYHLQAAYQSTAAAGTHCPHLTITVAGMPCTP